MKSVVKWCLWSRRVCVVASNVGYVGGAVGTACVGLDVLCTGFICCVCGAVGTVW